MQLSKYKNQSVAVFGLGKTGLSVINTLIKSGAKVYAWDDSEEQLANAKTMYKECNFIHPRKYDWCEIKALILSPGVPISYPKPHWIVKLARNFDCKIKSDIELFLEAKAANQKVIGVTGTNGKSTTTSLIGHILKSAGKKVAIGGNLGIPILDLKKDAEIYVVEFSSFQLELINMPAVIPVHDHTFFSGSQCCTTWMIEEVSGVTKRVNGVKRRIVGMKIDISVLLNITPDHIDRHGSMENYIAVKSKLISGSEVAVIGCDNEITADIFNRFTGNKIPISGIHFLLDNKKGARIQKISLKLKDYNLSASEAKMNLTFNAENIAATYAVCELLKIDSSTIIDGIKSFSWLKHRNELLGKIENVLFVNDSKATNAESSKKAILSYKNIYWIVGGKSKEGGIESLSKHFTRIRKAFLIGESTEVFASTMENKVDYVRCYNLENAFRLAFEEAIKSKEKITILLSPACASFDQWRNFEERGKAFCRMFENLRDSFTITCAV
ncbi:UDP-N-acetylmuramoyl-L-alanine--D-glutamate ligase [Wolbachia endosymbiont of Litomosoides brasiliensis]|uniref:UDP-N-acetylmuramoyl-L-alanine--D-glutamate ligase n=1 Tax=Wolbachia endosymbiont of Litomosoides brasiliensis TaxID=1812117 RepID=UPI00158CF918|nr:UDP-N-acetylmuramoyl-L-alanine--D-glutamate ligase [Wolbachia endosymbiont of Litomosoides brasiliensis]NUY39362.1 UDP-N-acetylmuramoyl-L-alanine--D-glutamate ligase [Wolbachia endosymbiont of Litomosoides brasiliensis]